MSDVTKRKISESQKGKIISEIQRKRHSEIMKGRKISEETKKKMSLAQNNPEVIQKKRMSQLGKKASDITKKKLSKHNSSPKRKQLQREILRQVRHNQQKPNLKELKIKEILTNSGLVFNPEQDLNRFNSTIRQI